jgi:hypothetical protein
MVVFRVIIGIIWVSILVLGRGIWTSHVSVTPTVSILMERGAPLSGLHTDEYRRGGETAGPRLDLYGNLIERAVGDYRTDFRGDLYERHAPDTAVLEPAPPDV